MTKCPYADCPVPENNNRFLLQIVYILIGIFVLLSKPENFTYFQTILFLAPILIDIVCSGPDNFIAYCVRWIIGVADVFIIFICILGLGGIVEETDSAYYLVHSMLLLGGISITKNFIGVLLIANLAIPVAYYFYTPCKATMKVRVALSAKGVGKK